MTESRLVAREAYDVQELAEKLGVGMSKARELTRRPDFPAIRLGRRVIIPVDRLRDWLNRQVDVQTQA